MNQILYTIENEQEKNRMRSITLFFGIVIIIFGILLMTTGGYSIAVSSAEKQKAKEAARVPTIELSFEDNRAIINVTHSREIKAIEYYWNNEEAVVINKQGEKNTTESIDVPAGINTLNVKATDVSGKNTSVSKEFAYEGTYMNLSVIDNKSLKIVITDVKGLQSATYKWNDGEEIVTYPSVQDPNVIELISNIPIGLNKIEVRAVNNDNEIETKEMQVQGIKKPIMDINPNEDKTLINIDFKDVQGILSYSYKVSNAPLEDLIKDGKLIENAKQKLTKIISETKEGNGQKHITEQIKFNEGFNFVEVTITNIEGAEETFTGWCAK